MIIYFIVQNNYIFKMFTFYIILVIVSLKIKKIK